MCVFDYLRPIVAIWRLIVDKYKVNVPEGKSGNWEVRCFSVSKEDAEFGALRSIFKGGRYTPVGDYTGLYHCDNVIMSDTPDEIRDHMSFIHRATGNVLINGLGIGMVLQAVLNKPEVTHVTVIEISSDVISLVAPHYQNQFGDRLTIIENDALKYKPPKGIRYNAIWHDIWPNICTDNLEEMKILHRKYGHCCNWQGSWSKELLKRYQRQEKTYWQLRDENKPFTGRLKKQNRLYFRDNLVLFFGGSGRPKKVEKTNITFQRILSSFVVFGRTLPFRNCQRPKITKEQGIFLFVMYSARKDL